MALQGRRKYRGETRRYGSAKIEEEKKHVFMALQRQRGNASLWLCKDRGETCLYDSAKTEGKNTIFRLCKDRGERRLYGSAKTEGKNTFLWLCKDRVEKHVFLCFVFFFFFGSAKTEGENTFLWLCKDRGETHLRTSVRFLLNHHAPVGKGRIRATIFIWRLGCLNLEEKK